MKTYSVPYPARDLSREELRELELKAIESYLKAHPHRCSHDYSGDPSLVPVRGKCDMIATREHEGKGYCAYHLPFAKDPHYAKKLRTTKFQNFRTDFNEYFGPEDTRDLPRES